MSALGIRWRDEMQTDPSMKNMGVAPAVTSFHPPALLALLRQRGISVAPDGDSLVIDGPVDDAVRQKLRQHKTEILAWFAARERI